MANPETPSPTPSPEVQLPRANAFFKIGFIQRNFNEMENVACIYDRNNNEAVVTFKSQENGATLSFRMLNLNVASGSHMLVNGKSKGVAFLNLGGNRSTNAFSLQLNPSNCAVNYQFTQTQMQGSFSCQNISNEQNQAVNAEGNWLCNQQSQREWVW